LAYRAPPDSRQREIALDSAMRHEPDILLTMPLAPTKMACPT
jgi:hypothetical protein